MASDKVNTIIESIEGLNVLELVELKKTMEEKWGVTAAAPVFAAGGMVAPTGAAGGDGGCCWLRLRRRPSSTLILTAAGPQQDPGDQGRSAS
jgi:large subunit ribosomal protein L7/L12